MHAQLPIPITYGEPHTCPFGRHPFLELLSATVMPLVTSYCHTAASTPDPGSHNAPGRIKKRAENVHNSPPAARFSTKTVKAVQKPAAA